MTYNLTRMVYGFSYVCIIKDYFGNTFFWKNGNPLEK